MVVNQNIQNTLRMTFRAAYNAYLLRPRTVLSQAYDMSVIETLISEEHWLGDVPGVEEWINEKTYQDLAKYDKILKSKSWTTRGFRFHAVEDAGQNVADIRTRMDRLIVQCERFPDRYIVQQLLLKGKTGVAFDGVPFFSGKTGARYINNILTSDASGADATEEELMTDLENVLNTMIQYESDTGSAIEIRPNLIICPFKYYLKFQKILRSAASVSQNENSMVINPFNEFDIRVAYSPFLSNSNEWYAVCTEDGIRPFYWQTTRVNGMTTELSIDEAKLKSMGFYGVSANIYGIGEYGFPWSCVMVENTN